MLETGILEFNIEDSLALDEKGVLQFLETNEGNEFIILFPRCYERGDQRKECFKECVFYEFAGGVYWGEMLRAVSRHFGYYTPDPMEEDGIHFQVVPESLDALASVISKIIDAFNNDLTVDEIHFYFLAEEFYLHVWQGVQEIGCNGLYETARRYGPDPRELATQYA